MQRPTYRVFFLWFSLAGAGGMLLSACGAVPVAAGPFSLLPGHLAVALLPVLAGWAMWRPRRALWGFSGVVVGVWAADFVRMIQQGDSRAPGPPGTEATAALLAAGAAAALAGAMLLARRRSAPSPTARSRWAAPIAVASLIATVLLLRAHYAYMIHTGVPNHERSTMLAGREIHHIATGSVGCYLLLLLAMVRPGMRMPKTAAAVAGVLAGAVGDEVLYYGLAHVTDAAYGQGISIAGAVGVGVLYCGMIFALCKPVPSPPEASA